MVIDNHSDQLFIYLFICAESTAWWPVPKTAQVLGDHDKKLRLAKKRAKEESSIKMSLLTSPIKPKERKKEGKKNDAWL
jgi:hypothetical protein